MGPLIDHSLPKTLPKIRVIIHMENVCDRGILMKQLDSHIWYVLEYHSGFVILTKSMIDADWIGHRGFSCMIYIARSPRPFSIIASLPPLRRVIAFFKLLAGTDSGTLSPDTDSGFDIRSG